MKKLKTHKEDTSSTNKKMTKLRERKRIYKEQGSANKENDLISVLEITDLAMTQYSMN